MTATLTLDEWAEVDATERELVLHHRYRKGAESVLRVLEAHVGEWVSLYDIQAKTGQKAVAQRVSELRHDHHFVIYCNKRAGVHTAYMLLPPPSFANVPAPARGGDAPLEPGVTVIKEARRTTGSHFPRNPAPGGDGANHPGVCESGSAVLELRTDKQERISHERKTGA